MGETQLSSAIHLCQISLYQQHIFRTADLDNASKYETFSWGINNFICFYLDCSGQEESVDLWGPEQYKQVGILLV